MKTIAALLFAVALIGCVYERQTTTSSSRWPFRIEGELDDADVAEIIAIVERIPDIDHRIVWIEAETPVSVLVHTGEMRGFLDGGGNVVTLKKRRGKWIVIDDPRESRWVS